MKTSPTLFLLTLFIIEGLSLECEKCLGLGDCSGNMVTCDIGKDRCSVTDMVLPIGLSVNIKTCVSSDVCDKGVQVINMGQKGKAVAHLKCCEGDECRNAVPPELPKKAPVNGKQCPACFALGRTCHEEVTDCTGDELYCAEGLLDSGMDILPLEVILKGCANKALCDSLVGYEAIAPENSGDHTMRCTPNSSTYQQEFTTIGINTIPRWFGFFITILSGILLRKLLA
ncbi:phospholipase A2 inhibitor 25 kDa subunit-like isoform X2 [Notechis scutatus]|uniref:Phospholipase A2 inhibitor 25 kDa subunit-like isoform X1 n=1 Tax=Notechis scutatus TaxID=8663 RepID=A0A6J1W3P4_9SAUR|nr:phospholipase A2 inhibitor 25 kDa subunit-like isoform X1 [Notechis scutatus]XP_026547029.1 phospholipase A2 inhibitor 25 kDa subunit-like isoform X2 [Notechis scutatus]